MRRPSKEPRNHQECDDPLRQADRFLITYLRLMDGRHAKAAASNLKLPPVFENAKAGAMKQRGPAENSCKIKCKIKDGVKFPSVSAGAGTDQKFGNLKACGQRFEPCLAEQEEQSRVRNRDGVDVHNDKMLLHARSDC